MPTALDLFQFDPKNPLRVQYNVTFQREVLPQTVVALGYIGSRGYHQFRNVESNQAIPIIQADGSYFFPATATGDPPAAIRTSRASACAHRRPLLVQRADRERDERFSGGLQFQASYTLGQVQRRVAGVGSADFTTASSRGTPSIRRTTRGGRTSTSAQLSSSTTATSCRSANATGVAGAIAQGGSCPASWRCGRACRSRRCSVSTAHARARARAAADSVPSWASASDRDNVILGGPEQYLDPDAFVLPAAGTFGDVERNALEGPGLRHVGHGGVQERDQFRRDRRLQFRLEAFNVLNRANFALPANTVFNSRGLAEDVGEITGIVGTARQMQVGVKFEF